MTTNRIEAFSDGVFAIAITLLVLNIKVPELPANASDAALRHDLLTQWPTYVSYMLSVVVVGIYWVGHHGLFHYIRRVNRTLFWLNLIFLLCVAFIPFPTALLGRYGTYRTAVVVYGASLVITGLSLDSIRWYATSKNRLVDADLDPAIVRSGKRRNLIGPVIYALAVALAFLDTRLSLALFVLVPALYLLPGQIDRYWRQTQQEE